MYKAMIEPPLGIPVTVRPDILVFNSTTKWKSPPPTRVNTGYYFGSLTWMDGVHTVSSPISVRTQLIQSYADDN